MPEALSATLAAEVIDWQRRHGRHALPWQGSRDPYRIWLSEVMLQQTQVSTVLAYYPRFVARWPAVQALAAAPLDEVFAMWSGLGYYRRARLLHRCAQVVVDEHQGRFPPDAACLASLPGVGRSTAAAIAAFAYRERAAILDGNVKRVLTRVLGFDRDIAVAANERALWTLATGLLPDRDVDIYTQGLMDLGAGVCLPRQPRCAACPLAGRCTARLAGDPQRYPVKTRKLARGRREHALLWLRHRGHLWLVPRPESGVWSGLWSLPEFESTDAIDDALAAWPGQRERLPTFKHVLTHFDWTLHPVRWTLPERGAGRALAELAQRPWAVSGRWVAQHEALTLGIPAPLRRLLDEAVPT